MAKPPAIETTTAQRTARHERVAKPPAGETTTARLTVRHESMAKPPAGETKTSLLVETKTAQITASHGEAPFVSISQETLPFSVTFTPRSLSEGIRIERYIILAKLGEGGMGVVYAAYDPLLDRKVALKFLLQGGAGGSPLLATEARARFSREAQALARLRHPNIVAIHDVGEHEGSVWLAMEYIDGEPLSAWFESRHSWAEVLDVMTPVARALQAAHEAGLIHRDIKPDNIMVGSDGRIHVMDLGLARALNDDSDELIAPGGSVDELSHSLSANVTRIGDILGTPAYMSPEQHCGAALDARIDIFSYCVTLWEGLMGERPFAGKTIEDIRANVLAGEVRPIPRDPRSRSVPGWLRRLCRRGLEVSPEQRIPSMAALLAEIARGRSRARLRVWTIAAAGVALLVVSTALYNYYDRLQEIALCERQSREIFSVWDEGVGDDIREHFLSTNASYAPETVDKIIPAIDAYANSWREHRREICIRANVEDKLTSDQLERALWCLEDRYQAFSALLNQFNREDEAVVRRAVFAVSRLSPLSKCTEERMLATLPPIPPLEERASATATRKLISRASSMNSAGNYKDGLELAQQAVEEARALGRQPLLASALALEGSLLDSLGFYEEGEAASTEAYIGASKAQAWSLAASTAIKLTQNVGVRQARFEEAKLWAELADVALSLTPDPQGLSRARALAQLGEVHYRMGEYEEAISLYSQAYELRRGMLGPEHPATVSSQMPIATGYFAMGKLTEARDLFRELVTLKEAMLGPNHPSISSLLGNLAIVTAGLGDYAEADRLHERERALVENSQGPEHPAVARSLGNHARVVLSVGDYDRARALHEREIAILEKTSGAEHPAMARALNNLADVYRAMGEYERAKELYSRALAIREKVLGPEHPHLAYVYGSLGRLALDLEQPKVALLHLEQAIAIFDGQEGAQEGELEAHLHLARALLVLGDRVRAVAEAQLAADGLRDLGAGKRDELLMAEAILEQYAEPVCPFGVPAAESP